MLAGRLLASFAAIVMLLVAATTHAIEIDDDDARRLAHLLGYVAADYANAVTDGAIRDRFEYEEQLALLDESLGLANATRLPDVADEIRALRKEVVARAEVQTVRERARQLRRTVIGRRRLDVLPPAPPDLTRGREVYRAHCTKCHGKTGRANTTEAARLNPPPVSFTDPTVVEALSPLRVADTVRFGIDGTAMVPFDFLSEADRWHVAFYVVSLRHTPRGSPDTPRLSLAELAISTDGAILDELYAAGASARELGTFLAELRARPTAPSSGRMADLVAARARLNEAALALARGERERPRALVSVAHARHVQPAKIVLAALEPALAQELDERLLALRARLASDDQEALHRDVDVATRVITRAQLALARFGREPRLGDEPGLGGVATELEPAPLWRVVSLLFGGAIRLLFWPAFAWLAAAMLVNRRRAFVAGVVGTGVGSLAVALPTSPTGIALLAISVSALVATHRGHRAATVLAAAAGFVAGEVITMLAGDSLAYAPATAVLLGIGGAVLLLAVVVAEGRSLVDQLGLHRLTTLRLLSGAVAVVAAGGAANALQIAGWLPSHPLSFVGTTWLGVHPSVEACAAFAGAGGVALWRLRGAIRTRRAAPA